MRVHTLTLNPAIDETITLDALVPGQVHRARGVRQNAGGKGINVASCLADWGVPVSAHGLLGRDNAAPFEALFAAKPITDAMARVDGATRVNLKLVDAHDTTDINLDGLAVTDETLATVLDGLAASAVPGDMVVLAGSLPRLPARLLCHPGRAAARARRACAARCQWRVPDPRAGRAGAAPRDQAQPR
ncbi:1-phosphofructokinase family hexose kinase [Novosphingobium pokkalii]|uniref:1-phosphofructokinase family hexose kinase n=1 Tax=Novosphingobium pokkalii TaxID=1770194 RepID=UPI00362F48DE